MSHGENPFTESLYKACQFKPLHTFANLEFRRMEVTDEELLTVYDSVMKIYAVPPTGTTVVRLKRSGGQMIQDCDIYIGRQQLRGGWRLSASDWANPFTVSVCGSNEEACRRYEAYVRKCPELMQRLPELQGKRLGCWCKPAPCHGDVLVKLLNECCQH